MRTALACFLIILSVGVSPLALALNVKDGRIVQGKYFATGNTSFANVHVHYGQSKVSVSSAGRISGTILKTITIKGQRASRSIVRVRGTVKKILRNGPAFSAATTIRISDGVVVHGRFRGLLGQPLSRYFAGEFSGVSRGRFLLRVP
jgi:hypothetical protein